MHRNKFVRLMLALILAFAVLLSLPIFSHQTAASEGTDEWSQFQKDEQNSGFSEIAVSQSHDILTRSGNIQAREGSQPVICGNKAFVYTGVDDTSGSIYCFDLSSNKKLWEREIGPPTYMSWSSPAVHEGIVYIGSGSSIHALDSQSGKILWKKDLEEFKKGALIVNSSPTVDDKSLFIGDWANGTYYSLDRKTGELAWKFELDQGCNAPSTPAISGNKVFVCQSAAYGAPISPNGRVWCLDKETGKPLASWGNNGFYQTDGRLDITGSVCVGEGKIYFADFKFGATEEPQNQLYCLDDQTGKEIWKAKVHPSSGTPAVVGETVFISCQQMAKDSSYINWTYAFRENGETGEVSKLWEKKGVGGFNISPAIARDKLIVAKTETDPSSWIQVGSGICALDCETGDIFWETEEGGSAIPTPYGVLSIAKGEMLLLGEGGERKGDYYFAEGTTREGFQEWICLENPNTKPVNVTIDYMTNSSPISPQSLTLPPTSRTTVDVNLYVGLGLDVAARVTGGGYFVAERAIYFKNWGLDGGDQVMGLVSPRSEYFFAEGTTRGGFQTWLAVGNPTSEPVNLLVNYFYGDGEPPKGENYELAPNSRMTIDVNTQAGAEKDVSIALRSNGKLCAERITYFRTPFDILGEYPGGVHNSTGVESLGTQYYFAEGTTRSNFAEWLCLFNPQGREASCSVRFATETGGVIKEEIVSIPPASRLTLDVKEIVGEGKDVSIFVESELPIAAERPIYFQYAPTCFSSPSLLDGGHNVPGIKYAAYRWDFAEGTTREGFETYLCLANPANRPANLSIEYITSEGGASSAVSETMRLESGFRKTIRVNDVIGSGKDVSIVVTSKDVPVIAERPIYFNHQGSMGGGCSPGLPGAL